MNSISSVLQVIQDFSSKIDHPLEVLETIDANHMQMARFSGINDSGYRKVRRALAGYTNQIKEGETISRGHEDIVPFRWDSEAQYRRVSPLYPVARLDNSQPRTPTCNHLTELSMNIKSTKQRAVSEAH